MQVGEYSVTTLDGVLAGNSEASLQGKPCTHYLISGSHERYHVPSLLALRQLLATTAFAACNKDFSPAAASDFARVVLRPTVAACLKACMVNEQHPLRARLAFDVDGGAGSRMPQCDVLHDIMCTALARVFGDVDWAAEPCVIFGGSFPDKDASFHVYFPNRCLFPDANNKYKAQTDWCNQLDAALSAFGALTIDRTITNSGLKYPFSDKWLKTHKWRGMPQEFKGCYNVEINGWYELFSLCDPVVCDTDAAWNNTLSFPRANKRVALPRQPVAAVAHVNGDDVLTKLYTRVPQWKGVDCKRRNGTTHNAVELLLFPTSCYCPILDGDHSTRGAGFALVMPSGAVVLKCLKSKCADSSITIPSANYNSALERKIVERFNESYAKLGGDCVIAVPKLLRNGKLSSMRMLNQKKFCDEVRTRGEIIGNGRDAMEYSKFWLQHPQARKYLQGIVCDPSGTADPDFYNTYTGVDPRVYAASVRMDKLNDEQLLAKFPAWYRCLCTNMCGDEQPVIDYVLNMYAHAVQLPSVKPGVALVFTGPPGCGKGLCIRALVNIYGAPHGMQICATDLNTAFNGFCADVVVLFVDETEQSTGHLLDNAALKMRITEASMTINAKYQPQRKADQFDHVFISSNATHNGKLAIEYQPGERRYMGVPADYRIAEPQSPEHIALGKALAAEICDCDVLGAMYAWLLRRDISNFSPNVMPVSSATWKLQYASMSALDRFVYKLLLTGNVCVRSYEPDNKLKGMCESLMSTAVLAGDRGVDVSELGYNVFGWEHLRFPSDLVIAGFQQLFPREDRVTDSQLWRALNVLSNQWDKRQVATPSGRVQSFKFPNQHDLRVAFLRLRGNLDARIWNEWKME